MKYVLHPGYVNSISDRDRHYIGAARLARLYGVRMSECAVCYRDHRDRFRAWPEDAKHLYPRFSGDYSLPVEEK